MTGGSAHDSIILLAETNVSMCATTCRRKDGSMQDYSKPRENKGEVIHRRMSHPVDNVNQSSSTRQPESRVTALTNGQGSRFVPVDGSRCLPAWMIGISPFIFCVVLAGCIYFFGQSFVGIVSILVGALGAFGIWILSVHTS